MFKNYLKTALRNLYRYKSYSLIKIVGLAVGIACCILIMLWVVDEWNYDRFHQRAPDLYRMMTEALYAEDLPAITLYHPAWYWAHDGKVSLYYTDGGIASGIPIPLNKMTLLGK